MPNISGLAPAGSSTYASNTLHVGDGTWDAGRQVFLLPNLVGLNFATMQYNGMGNRFAGMPDYYRLVLGHGILAVITFLLIVPLSIFIPRFYTGLPVRRIKMHIWLQILTVLLSTIILVLGWFAVGPERSLSNPHHGIGLAIYVLIIFQAIYGLFVRNMERKREMWKISVKMMLHQWLGWATALLAIIQVALGLTLYGSPKYLFIVYALWGFALIMVWFILSHRFQRGYAASAGVAPLGDGTTSEYYSEHTQNAPTDVTPQRSRIRALLGALAAGGGIAAITELIRSRRHRRDEEHDSHTEYTTETSHYGPSASRYSSHRPERHSHHQSDFTHSDNSYEDEKDDYKLGWTERILAGAGIAGIAALATNWLRNRKSRTEESGNFAGGRPSGPLGPPGRPGSEGGFTHSSYNGRSDYSRMEEGRPAPYRIEGSQIPTTPTRTSVDGRNRYGAITPVPVAVASPSRHSRLHPRRSGTSFHSSETPTHADDYVDDYASPGRDKRKSHALRDGIAGLGIAKFFSSRFGKKKTEDERVAEMRRRDEEAEHLQRQNSARRYQHYTGDGRPPRRNDSFTETDMQSTVHPSQHSVVHRTEAAVAGLAAAGAGMAALHHHRQQLQQQEQQQQSQLQSHSQQHLHPQNQPIQQPYPPLATQQFRQDNHSDSIISPAQQHNVTSVALPTAPPMQPQHAQSSNLPLPNPAYAQQHYSSDSDGQDGPRGQRPRPQTGIRPAATETAGLAAEGVAEVNQRPPRRETNTSPYSLEVQNSKTPQGRQRMRIRRLAEEEAAQIRAGRTGASQTSFATSGDEGWRRTEARPGGARLPPAFQLGDLRPAPSSGGLPIPGSSSPAAFQSPPGPSVPLPGSTTAGSNTGGGDGGMSATESRADSRRRKRRADRARLEQVRTEGHPRVDWA